MNTDLTSYIDAWLDEHAWHLDQRVLDFALDVRLIAAGETLVEAPEATPVEDLPVPALSGAPS